MEAPDPLPGHRINASHAPGGFSQTLWALDFGSGLKLYNLYVFSLAVIAHHHDDDDDGLHKFIISSRAAHHHY